MNKYALYDYFRMQEYHQFLYFIVALERFELEKIRYAGYEISEKRTALQRSQTSILNDVLR
jgi:hypothetical protein